MAGENLRAFELTESIYNRYINDYGSEENIDVRLKQSFQMTKSRMVFEKITGYNKNYMSIGVSVRTGKSAALSNIIEIDMI